MRALLILCVFLTFYLSSANANSIDHINARHIKQIKSEILAKLESFRSPESSWRCAMCRGSVEVFHFLYHRPMFVGCLSALIDYICNTFKIEDTYVCNAVISEYRTEMLYILEKLALEHEQVCSLMFKNCGTPIDRFANWTIPIPPNKPPVEKWKLPQSGSKTMRVLHLSDIHFDKLYTPEADSDCDEPLCCRARNGFTGKKPAGYWGTVSKCDMPSWTLENFFQHLAQKEKFDYIIWTGDLPPHNIWNQSRSDQIFNLKTLTGWFLKYFPGIPIFSAVGNHESAPADSFPPHNLVPEKYSVEWLYDTLAEEWKNWLPKAAESTIKWRASYSVSPFPGFRLISLNTQYSDRLNFWLYMNQTDPDGTMSWLTEQLTKAEENGEKVHIIGHIPPGHSTTFKQWSTNYYQLVNRFESTIRSQFFGHTHTDSFSVFYDGMKYPGRPTSHVHVAPSLTTYTDHIPAYRVYTMDGNYKDSTWTVLDHETYAFDLDKANKENITEWNLEYTAKGTYGLTSLFPEDWDELITRMRDNDTLFENYRSFYGRTTPEKCDEFCKMNTLCELRTARSQGSSDDFCADMITDSMKKKHRFEEELRAAREEFESLIDNMFNHHTDKTCWICKVYDKCKAFKPTPSTV